MRKGRVILLALVLLFAGVCAYDAGYGPSAAGFDAIVPDQRIPVTDSPQGSGNWKSNDLSINYQYVRDENGLLFSGTIEFNEGIKLNFPLMPSFHAELIFGDSQGRVIATSPLLTTRQSGFERQDPIEFSRRINVPSGAAMFAFSYQGELVETGGGGRRRGGGGSNLTRIWHYPVTAAPAFQKQK